MGVFGDLIAELQQRNGWSFSRFSRETELSTTRLQQILKLDEPKVYGSTLGKLAKAFGMSLDELRVQYVERLKDKGVEKVRKMERSAGIDALIVALPAAVYAKVAENAAKEGISVDQMGERMILESARARFPELGIITDEDLAGVIPLTESDTESNRIPTSSREGQGSSDQYSQPSPGESQHRDRALSTERDERPQKSRKAKGASAPRPKS